MAVTAVTRCTNAQWAATSRDFSLLERWQECPMYSWGYLGCLAQLFLQRDNYFNLGSICSLMISLEEVVFGTRCHQPIYFKTFPNSNFWNLISSSKTPMPFPIVQCLATNSQREYQVNLTNSLVNISSIPLGMG